MKRLALGVSLTGWLLVLPSGVVAQKPPAAEDYVKDEVLVSVEPGADVAQIARGVGARVHGEVEGLGVHVLKVPSGRVPQIVAALSRNPRVEFAEPNGYLHAFPTYPSDPSETGCYATSGAGCTWQWAWEKVSAYDAWDVTTGSASVRVAVVDTGIDVGDPAYPFFPDYTGHEDIVSCQTPIIKSYVYGETGNDDNGHGTHVAGTIGACTNNNTGVAGANWAVQLMGVKVLDYSGSGTLSAVASGISWAANNGAKVINLSLGTSSPYRTLERAVNNAWKKNAVLVCAAGNAGTSALTYPAAYDRCIAVAATDDKDAKASFSNYGASWVDVAAPGVNILSTMQDQWDWCFLCYGYGYFEGYDALSGTSMATPHVAGLAALVWARGTCTTNTCVRGKIESTADLVAGTGTQWRYGRVNYYRAIAP